MKTSQQISEAEQARRARQPAMSIAQEHARQRGMSIPQFCARYGIARTSAYGEISAKRLLARKCGKRTIITEDDAEDWLRQLPVIEVSK